MSFWWVNHKQTFSSEVEGGYIWSPKENSNGARNQTYTNLTLTKPGDVVFSYAGGEIKAVGIVADKCREQVKPTEFGKSGDAWSNVGWAVPIDWEVLSVHVVPKHYIDRIAPLLPIKNAPIRSNGNGNQSCYLAGISEELGELLLSIIRPANVDIISMLEDEVEEVEAQGIIEQIRQSVIEYTEKEQIIKARKGQGIFRKNVEHCEHGCRVTGVNVKNLLVASHIKPWRISSNVERLDGFNGLLLSPHIDKLFDKGWITFLADGSLVCSTKEIADVLLSWGVALPTNVGKFNDKQAAYLKFHNDEIFKG